MKNSPIRLSAEGLPGFGSVERIDDLHDAHNTPIVHHGHKLGEWFSTAICGNDITSSCLYVSALCAIYAGPYAPIALAIVAAVLFLFRKIYVEVVTALPLNGGAYNVLLNTTSKGKATIAACLTILSYLATAVISASEAMHYAHNLWSGLNIFTATIVLLGFFALLNILGMSESAIVAFVLFVVHMLTLTVLSIAAFLLVTRDTSILLANWHTPAPGGVGKAIFFGFSAALLGISGFESSANFIEEQKPGVFAKTLRNMWIAVAVFNPLICTLALGLLPLADIANNKNDLLAQMGLLSAGKWLQWVVSVDAVLVLSGAVLTSYVGVLGLVRRMSLDRCLPQFLLQENKWRETNHWIIGMFFLLCCTVLFVTGGQIEALAGVYTLSFLGVMALFALGNMLLKVKRARLPRAQRAKWPAVIVAFLAVLVGIVGTLQLNPEYARIFALYFIVALLIVGTMLMRVEILKVGFGISRSIIDNIRNFNRKISHWLVDRIDIINSQSVIFFSKGDNLVTLNRAALYVLSNEQTKRMRVVHCYENETDIPPDLAEQINIIDRIYPELRIDLILVKAKFSPELIEALSSRLGIAKNYMFLGTPGDHFPHNIAELGGVRLIM